MARLELLVSPPGTGKTTHCIDLFKERILRSRAGIDSRAYFVLPSREHADRIQSLIVRRDVPGLFNAHVLTIQDLADRFLTPSGKGRPTESVRRAAIAEALAPSADGSSDYGYFRESAALAGFHELALEAVREFKAGLLSVEEFERRARPLVKDAVFRSKYRDFSILLKRYEAKLASLGLAEAEDELLDLGSLDGAEAPGLVIFDGFYHFTRAQKKLLVLVSRLAERAVVTLTLDPEHGAGDALFDYPSRTRRFLLEAGFREADRLAENHRVADPALRHLAARVFSPAGPAYAAPAPVAVFSAPSRRVEFEMIAREIRRLYRSEKCHFSDFCVILRAVSGRRGLIESVFSEFGVPVSIHERTRLTENGAAAALARFLRLGAEGWLREDVTYLARSSYFRGTLSPADALALERAALRENVVSGREAWEALVASGAAEGGARAFLSALLSRHKALLESASPHEFGAHVEGFLKPLGAAGDADAAARRAVATILASGRRRWARAGSFDGARYAAEVLAALEGGLMSQKARGRNRVQVYDAVMALPKEYRIVFIADLIEKTFPQGVTEDPIFKDDERRAMNGADPVLEERSGRLSGERYFFYMAVTRARERLYLTHATHDDDGKPALASFFIDEALRPFAPGAVKRLAKGPAEFLPSPSEWEGEADLARGLAAITAASPESRPAFFGQLVRSLGSSEALSKALAGAPVGPARLKDPLAVEAMRSFAGPFSASGFDSFFKCAYRHFAESLLGLKRPPEGFHDAEMGEILHGVLYDYFSALPAASLASGEYWKEPEAMERALEALLDERLKSAFRDQPLYRRAMFRESMLSMLKSYAALERRASGRGFAPFRFEWEFGKGGAAPLKIADESGDILLRGSIDRIDVDPGGRRAVIIDYKKSSRGLNEKLKKGEEIQLPLYSYAAKALLGLEPVGIEHRVLKTGQCESPRVDLEALLAATEARVRVAVRRIRAGEIAVEPRECDFCPFDPVCRVEARKDRRAH